ncbi:hypothetical protein BW14_08515 [Bifidobacterium sp. UTBIF-68]|uniref:MFS transporter n=1 Tax=Bifidobacterium sp. UTBIF-68 TaxID=1465262 RepID=UPI0035BFAE53|nr:hypothetical protein BW14_08515 [Bifidobacterium sp. UTBIF-68]
MNALKTRIGILSLSSITLSGIFIVPIIGMVAQAFPDSSLSGVQMIISASTLTALVGAWLTGKLASVLSRKTVALIGAGGILLFGMLPYFIHSGLAAVIAFSALMGVCLGFINNILPTLISVHYEGEQRQSVMGQQVAVASIGAMVFMGGQARHGPVVPRLPRLPVRRRGPHRMRLHHPSRERGGRGEGEVARLGSRGLDP